jgi:hypothetical protein
MVYEVLSVLSGVTLVVMAIVPGVTTRNRFGLVGGGVAFIAYAIYVANQTDGTYFFTSWIFVIPFVGAVIVTYDLMKARNPNVGNMTLSQVANELVSVVKGRSTVSHPSTRIDGSASDLRSQPPADDGDVENLRL